MAMERKKTKICETVKQNVLERIRDGVATSIGESRRLGIPSSTIRSWIQKEKQSKLERRVQEFDEARKIMEEPPPPVRPGMHPTLPSPDKVLKDEKEAAPVHSTEVPNIVEQIRMSAFDGFTCSAESLRQLREKAPATVNHIVETLITAIARIRLDLEEGMTYKHAVFQGDMTEHRVHMTVQDRVTMTNLLKSLTEQFVKLAVIPYGSIDPSRLIEPKEPINQQHLHLHSHGSTSHKPLTTKIKGEQAQDSNRPPTIELQKDNLAPWQKDLLS